MNNEELQKHYQEQRQRERDARLNTARRHARDNAELAHTLSTEVWAEVDKELS